MCCPCNIPLRGCPIRRWRRQRHAWPSWIIVLELNLELGMMNKSKVMNLGLTCKLVRDRSRFRNRKQNNSRQDQVGLGELAKIDNHKDIVYLVYDSAKWIILYFVSTYRHFFLSNIKCTLVCFLGLIHNVFSLVSGGDFSQVSVVIALHFQVEDFGLARGRLNALLYNCLLYNWRERPKFKQKKVEKSQSEFTFGMRCLSSKPKTTLQISWSSFSTLFLYSRA